MLIERTFGVRYHTYGVFSRFRSLGAALRVHGWSPQQPRPRARERDEVLVAAWLRRDWPRIKKRLAAYNSALSCGAGGCLDALHRGRNGSHKKIVLRTFRARLGRTWAPVGRPPVLRRLSQRREVSSVVALVAPLDGPPRLYARHFHGSIHAPEVIVALRYFRQRIGRPLIVVCDRLQAHRSKEVQEFVAAHPEDYAIEWLPSYTYGTLSTGSLTTVSCTLTRAPFWENS